MHTVVTKHKTGHVACLYGYKAGNFSAADTSAHVEQYGLRTNTFSATIF
jgi:hypothetical protein